MRFRNLTAGAVALLLTGTVLAGTSEATSTSSHPSTLGTQSLAQVLAADGHHFDKNSHDFDILDKFVTRILIRKPGSDLAVLTDGTTKVTAFLPTDGAFRRAATQILGHRWASERRVFRKLWRAGGLRTSEKILLSHVVEGRTLTSHRLRTLAPTRLHTLEGSFVRIRVHDHKIWVLDESADSPNAHVYNDLRNINKGNRQIGHGVSALLSPIL